MELSKDLKIVEWTDGDITLENSEDILALSQEEQIKLLEYLADRHNTTLLYTASFERFSIEMTRAQVDSCSHQGQCYEDSKATLDELNLTIEPHKVRDELKEYGAWTDEELSDDRENLIRIVWLAACQIKDEIKS